MAFVTTKEMLKKAQKGRYGIGALVLAHLMPIIWRLSKQ